MKQIKPLGMKNSHFHDDYTQLIKNRNSEKLCGKGVIKKMMGCYLQVWENLNLASSSLLQLGRQSRKDLKSIEKGTMSRQSENFRFFHLLNPF